MAAAAAPALAFGPPGWAVFAVAVVVTGVIGYEAYEHSPAGSTTAANTDAKADTKTKCATCSRPWSVRVHAQGTDIGGTTGSTVGAPAIVQQSPISAAQGVALAGATFALLTKRQAANLADADAKCTKFITTCGGFLGSKSFYGRSQDNNRFDVDSYGPSNNFVS